MRVTERRCVLWHTLRPANHLLLRGRLLLTVVGFMGLLVVGCGPKIPDDLPGYSHLAGDTYYKLICLGTGSREAQHGDYVTVLLRYSTPDDSVFFWGGRRFLLEKPSYPGSIDECFASLRAGDSATFMLQAQDFFTHSLASTLPHFLDSGDRLRIDVRMVDITDSTTFAQEKEAFLHWVEDFDLYEEIILQQYLQRTRLAPREVDSIYYVCLRPGQGEHPQNGDTLTLDFEGRFFDGKYFDSTIKRGEAFQFVLGQRWQVIHGLERAVRLMRPGERALFILPSSMAFGKGGSSTGIVPPYTPVIFEVSLLECQRGVERQATPQLDSTSNH